MAAANRIWGAERVRGELRKLGVRVAKTTDQRHMRDARPPRRTEQAWATFLRNHAGAIWACDFLPVTDLLFRSLHAFVVVALGSRSGSAKRPRSTSGITQVQTAYRAPRQNALGEQHLRRVLREYADYFNQARPQQAPH